MPRIGLIFLFGLALTAEGGPRPSDASPPAAGGLLLVANKGDHTLGIVDPAGARPLATVEESGVTGHEVIASPDGRTAYVPIYGNSGVGRAGSDGQTLDGVVTITDLIRARATGATGQTPASQFMTSNPVALAADDDCAASAHRPRR